MLPRGMHQLRIVADSGEGAVRLLWRSPDRATEIVPEWAVFGEPVTNNGLLGRYFANGEWSGDPALVQIDRGFDMYFHIPALARPYTVEWTGKIAIPEGGRYGFGLASNDESMAFIDGDEIARSTGGGGYGEGFLELEAGLHDIVVRFADRSDHTFVTLYWIPPNAMGARQVVPDGVLFPPQGNYERVALPSLAELDRAPGAAGAPADAVSAVPAEVEVVVQGLEQPAGIAALPDGVAVALPGEGRVVVYDEAGIRVREVVREGAKFAEPFDVVADEGGVLYVLDAGSGLISRFEPGGQYTGDLGTDAASGSRARGIGIDSRGGVWIASTPGGSIVRYDLEDGSVTTAPCAATPGRSGGGAAGRCGRDGGRGRVCDRRRGARTQSL